LVESILEIVSLLSNPFTSESNGMSIFFFKLFFSRLFKIRGTETASSIIYSFSFNFNKESLFFISEDEVSSIFETISEE
ncbi:hypothetical protein, partial [Enterococcus faecium]|uniref:hypothetical protein n=7 Tax=Enterococcus faecium TaxID=1352 RepID=UPI000B2C0450